MKRVLVSWSSGKDSAWMLRALQQANDCEIIGLVTAFNETNDRVSIHGVRRELVLAQSAAVNIPFIALNLPASCSNEEYERRYSNLLARQAREGATHFAFGDLFLEDIRDYRIKQLTGSGIEPLFPLWNRSKNTADLAREMIAAGLRAVVTCVDATQLPAEFLGREFDAAFLAELPSHVDPCGERGEFHTFCYAGPHMQKAISISVGPTHVAERFLFAEMTPQGERPESADS
jgi:uncharacterized protein (TIGR00290 family)